MRRDPHGKSIYRMGSIRADLEAIPRRGKYGTGEDHRRGRRDIRGVASSFALGHRYDPSTMCG